MHTLTERDTEARTGVCSVCGPVRLRNKGAGKWGCPRSGAAKRRNQRPGNWRPYRRHLTGTCERCGFLPQSDCQLDIHHRDGNHGNNDLTNLATLCANCHRLEHSHG